MKLLWNEEIVTRALNALDIDTLENICDDFSSNQNWGEVKEGSDAWEEKVAIEMMHGIVGKLLTDALNERKNKVMGDEC